MEIRTEWDFRSVTVCERKDVALRLEQKLKDGEEEKKKQRK